MPVTAIKRIQNRSRFSVTLQSIDAPSAPSSTPFIDPGADFDLEIWIPWAPASADFPQHRLTVIFGTRPFSFVIWQAFIPGDGDFVRHASDGSWHNPGLKIGGLAEVGGDRYLVVSDDKIALVEPGRHGVTSIIRIDNGASVALSVLALDGNSPVQSFNLDPGESLDVDIWIPWAPNRIDFDRHNIELSLDGASRWKLWQADHSDGDYVRVTTDASWSDPGVRIGGTDQVGGDRALVVLDDSIELMSAQRRPSPPAGEGDETITLNETGTQFEFRTEIGGHLGRTIVSVTNDTHDTNDQVNVPLIVNLDTNSGNVGRTRIEPNDSSNAFAGFPFDGRWFARAVDVNQVFLRAFVTLSVHWNRGPPAFPDIVTCVRRNGGNIIAIGGAETSGSTWTLSEQAAIQEVKNGRALYVIGVSGKRTRIVVGKRGMVEFLRTMADNDTTNNLSKLPSCPQ